MLQFVGCALSVYDAFAQSAQEEREEISKKIKQALHDRAGISAHDAEKLFLSKGNLSRRFQLAWDLMSTVERAKALWMNYSVFENYWSGLQYYNLALQPLTHLSLETPEELIRCGSFNIPKALTASKVKPHIDLNITIDSIADNLPTFFQEFLELRDLCKILRYSQFQLIGCLLSRRDVYKKDDPQAQIFDDSLTIRLLKGMGVEESTAYLLICEDDIGSQFKRVWAILSDQEKSLAITTDYERFDNFWPKFDVYTRTLSKHIKLFEKTTQHIYDDSELV